MNQELERMTGQFHDVDVYDQPYFVVTCGACDGLLRVTAEEVGTMTEEERNKAFLCSDCEISMVDFPEPSELKVIGKTILLIVLCMIGVGVGIFILLAFASALPG